MGTALTPSARGRAMLVALAVLPWLGLFVARGGQGAAALIGQALALVAAWHGAGSMVAWGSGTPGMQRSAWLRVAWGAATLIAFGGVMMMVGWYGAADQSALLFLGVIAHSAELVRGARSYATALGEARGWRWGVTLAVLTAVTLLHLLGNAGAAGGAMWNGEAHVLGQMRLLADTGHLGDGAGFARSHSLGGGLVLSALAGLPWARAVDSLGMAVFLALAAARLLASGGDRRRDGAWWAGLVVLGGVTFSRFPTDAGLYWWPATLLLAGAGSVEDRVALSVSARRAAPAVLVAAALAVLHYALVPPAIALAGVAVWPHRKRRSVLWLGALALVAVAPYLVERAHARGELPALALAWSVPRAGLSLVRLLLAAVVAAALTPLVRWLVEDLRVAVLFAAALAGAAVSLFGVGAYVLVAALALAAFAAWRMAGAGAEAGAGSRGVARPLPLGAALLSLFLLVSLYEAQERRGGLRWSYRWTALSSAAGYVLHGPAEAPAPSAPLLNIPDGATVALWIYQPERLDHRRHRFLDVRTPFFAALRATRGEYFARALRALRPTYLLYEADLPASAGAAGDPLAELVDAYSVVWAGDGLQLVSFRPPSSPPPSPPPP